MNPTQSIPVFDFKVSQLVPPYLHAKTGRTIARHQESGDVTHLFSATGSFIETVKTSDAKAAAQKSEAEAKAAEKEAQALNDTVHAKRVAEATKLTAQAAQ